MGSKDIAESFKMYLNKTVEDQTGINPTSRIARKRIEDISNLLIEVLEGGLGDRFYETAVNNNTYITFIQAAIATIEKCGISEAVKDALIKGLRGINLSEPLGTEESN